MYVLKYGFMFHIPLDVFFFPCIFYLTWSVGDINGKGIKQQQQKQKEEGADFS
jgi:hypothetical protein